MNLQEKLLELKTAYYNVFKNRDAFGRMFQEHITERIVLQLSAYHLKKNQFTALMKTLEAMGEKSFYLSEIEFSDCFDSLDQNKDDTYIYKNDIFPTNISYEEYANLLIVLENALYSPTGKWGVIISHEDSAVIGGTHEFMTLFKKFYPHWENDLKDFIETWKFHAETYKVKVSWLPDFLKYVNTFSTPQVNPEKWKLMTDAFTKVFKDMNFTETTFQDSIQKKLILSPTNGFYLNKKQFEALSNVLKTLGESSFYISQVNGWNIEGILSLDARDNDHFVLRSDILYKEYQKNVITLENILYSTKGSWGILLEENQAIIGGSQDFIELFKKYYPQWEEDEKAFIKMWEEKNKQNGIDISWMPKLLELHKYNSEAR